MATKQVAVKYWIPFKNAVVIPTGDLSKSNGLVYKLCSTLQGMSISQINTDINNVYVITEKPEGFSRSEKEKIRKVARNIILT